jgi:hypothetical protein
VSYLKVWLAINAGVSTAFILQGGRGAVFLVIPIYTALALFVHKVSNTTQHRKTPKIEPGRDPF